MANSLVTSAILGVNVWMCPRGARNEDDCSLSSKHNNGADLTITDDISEVKGSECALYGCVCEAAHEKRTELAA